MESISSPVGHTKRTRNASNRRFSMPRIFRDIHWLGSQRTRRNGQENVLVTSNSCSSQVEEDDPAVSETLAALLECPICTIAQPISAFPRFANAQCQHLSCADCIRHYLTIEITESRTELTCPVCAALLHPDDVRQFLGPDCVLVQKYDEFTLRRALVVDPDVRWCPAPDCGYAVIASGCAGCPKLHCQRPGCGTLFCYHCKQTWHANQTCSAARAKRLSSIHSLSSFDSSLGSGPANDVKACPRCGALIVKMDDGSCNHMTCTVCAAEFCWLCMQEISDIHYLSPSGCTFWGKKPWSRKKKILLQLGMLVGGPVGISLIAVAAVPAIIIGFPVWVGKKLYRKFAKMSRHRRNLILTSGVLSSVILAPLLSIMAVVIGVPLLLAYVYGVVPVSLCRSIGSCGLKTTGAGVRINFDDDSPPASFSHGPFQSALNIAGDREYGQIPGDDASVHTSAVFAENDVHIANAGSSSEQESTYGDSLTGGQQRKLTLDRILTRLEVHAEVSFNPAGSSRRSLGEGTSATHCSVKSRSSATVSFSDIISTSQDVDDSHHHMLTPQASNMSLDSGAGLVLAGRSASVAGSGTSFLPRSIVRPGAYRSPSPPPLAKRSVSFVRDIGGSQRAANGDRCDVTASTRGVTAPWAYKRQCMSVGDSIDERVESTNADYLSVRSLATPAGVCAQKLEPCTGGSDIVAMVAGDVSSMSPNGGTVLIPGYHRSVASDGISSRSVSSNLGYVSTSAFQSQDDLHQCTDCPHDCSLGDSSKCGSNLHNVVDARQII